MTKKEVSVWTAQLIFSVQLETQLYWSQMDGGKTKQLLLGCTLSCDLIWAARGWSSKVVFHLSVL